MRPCGEFQRYNATAAMGRPIGIPIGISRNSFRNSQGIF